MKFNGKWLPEKPSYREACLRLSKDLSNFKRDPEYSYFVGNDTRGEDVVEAFDEVVWMPYLWGNDLVGNPVIHYGKSAGTLRYMKVLQDVDKLVGLVSTENEVIEIGGGYGGQSLICACNGICEYTIIDIPEAIELQKAYLKENNVECDFVSSEEVKSMSTDILISDYCLSEFDQKGVDFYLNLIDFKFGYFTGMISGISRIVRTLQIKGYDCQIKPEVPKTSKHDNYILTARK